MGAKGHMHLEKLLPPLPLPHSIVSWPTLQIGNTPMIGLNDVETETFYLADAHKASPASHAACRWRAMVGKAGAAGASWSP